MIEISVSGSEAMKDLCTRMADIVEECIIDEFIEWAKQDDEYLRNNEGFINHTGNLRSSLGAAVFKDGNMVFRTAFETILNGAKGSQEGMRAVDEVASEYTDVIAKVMVAGMDYAQKVEDIDTKDVLESRIIQCRRDAQAVLESAFDKAVKKIEAL